MAGMQQQVFCAPQQQVFCAPPGFCAPPMACASTSWPTSICGCMEDCSSCCYGYFCLCCLFGDNAQALGHGSSCLNCCLYCVLSSMVPGGTACLAAPLRGRLRASQNLSPEPCSDCCTHFWCGACAVCQEARVIKASRSQGSFYAAPATQMMVVAPSPKAMAAPAVMAMAGPPSPVAVAATAPPMF